MKTYRLLESPELTPVEAVLIESIYYILNRKDELTKQIIDNIGDYKKVLEAAQELEYIIGWRGNLKHLKEQFFERATVTTLSRIVMQDKFTPESRWQEPFLISQEVLRDFGYGAEIRQGNPKAEIAKKLGAKIVL